MKKLSYTLRLVGVIQIVLGLGYLAVPQQFLAQMGHSPIAADIAYPLGMLAARFLVYGALMLFAANRPEENRQLILGMVAIQIVDLAAGIFYTANGTVPLSLSGFPMFNAAWIALLLFIWRPAQKREA